jgi:hypothetical protein
MGPNNTKGTGNQQKKAATAISKYMLCKTSADNTVTPCAATTDAACWVAQEDVASGEWGAFAPFTGDRDERVLISANVAAGAKLGVDASNAGMLKTVTTGIGVAVADEAGTYSAGIAIKARPFYTAATA